jgi:DNA mismatch endonuclease (patch repair protein)
MKDDVESLKSSDSLTPSERSKRMSLIKNKDSKIEKTIRSFLFSLGYRYRIHYKELPGHPDIVFTSKKKVIFINGCFWHGHDCGKYKFPQSNTNFWKDKIKKNTERDEHNHQRIEEMGWKIMDIWECQISKNSNIFHNICVFLENG